MQIHPYCGWAPVSGLAFQSDSFPEVVRSHFNQMVHLQRADPQVLHTDLFTYNPDDFLLTQMEVSYLIFTFLLSNTPLPNLLFEVLSRAFWWVLQGFSVPGMSFPFHPTPPSLCSKSQRDPPGELIPYMTLTHSWSFSRWFKTKIITHILKETFLTPLAAQSTGL